MNISIINTILISGLYIVLLKQMFFRRLSFEFDVTFWEKKKYGFHITLWDHPLNELHRWGSNSGKAIFRFNWRNPKKMSDEMSRAKK